MKIVQHIFFKARTLYKYTNYANVLQKSARNIYLNSSLYRKMFLEQENRYAYDIMKNNGYAADILASTRKHDVSVSKDLFLRLSQETHSKKTPTQLIYEFSQLGLYCSENNLCISNKIFDSFIDALTDNLHQASDHELRLLFYYLLQWPETESIQTRNFIEVWVALDNECLNRVKNWSFDEMLTYIALFYMLNVTKVSDFSLKCLQKMASKAKQLTPNQLVQTMFFIGVMRKSPFDIHNLELHLDMLFPEFTIDELAIMSMGFFKSKTPVRNLNLIFKMIDKLIKNTKNIHEVSLAALLKIIRYSMKVDSENKIYLLLDALQDEVPRLSIMCNVHVALLGTATLTLHEKCLTQIANVALKCLDKARIKDLERLVFTYGTFNLFPKTSECFFNETLKELRNPKRYSEIQKHGRSFACCVAYLGYMGIYPVDLMNSVLSTEFLQNTYGKQMLSYGREVLAIHNSAKIFCPISEMNRLSDKGAIILAKKYTDFVPSENFIKQYNVSEKMMLDVIKTLKEYRGGEDYVTGDHIVTHHQRGDVIICNDHNGNPMNVTKHFTSSQFGTLRKAPDDNTWVALVLAGRNGIIHNTGIVTGPFQTKVRELEALGFNAALVLWTEYSKLDTTEAKIDHLNRLINEVINTKNKNSQSEIKKIQT